MKDGRTASKSGSRRLDHLAGRGARALGRALVAAAATAALAACGGAPGEERTGASTAAISGVVTGGGGIDVATWSGNTSFVSTGGAVTQTLSFKIASGLTGSASVVSFGAAVASDGTPNPFSLVSSCPPTSDWGCPVSDEIVVSFQPSGTSSTPTQWNATLGVAVQTTQTAFGGTSVNYVDIPLIGFSGLPQSGGTTISFSVPMETTMANGAVAPSPSGAQQSEPVAGWYAGANEAAWLDELMLAGCTGPMWVLPNASNPEGWWLASLCPTAAMDAASPTSLSLTSSGTTFVGPITPALKMTVAKRNAYDTMLSEGYYPSGSYGLDMFVDYSGATPLAVPAPAGYAVLYYEDPNGCGSSCSLGVRTEGF